MKAMDLLDAFSILSRRRSLAAFAFLYRSLIHTPPPRSKGRP